MIRTHLLTYYCGRVLGTLLCTTPLVLFLSSAQAADELPPRKAGLWEVTMRSSGEEGAPPAAVSEQCVDAESDKKMQEMGRGMQDNCSLNETKRSGDTISIKSVCKLQESTISSDAVFSGNFQDSYHAKISATFNPPLMGMSGSTTTLDARYLGACKADQKPGDIVLPGGMKMNVFSMPGGHPGAKK
jgi:hypothetical protein